MPENAGYVWTVAAFGEKKSPFSKIRGNVWTGSENGDSSYSCGRVKTKAFKYDDVMPKFKARSSARIYSKTLRVDADFFKYGEKNFRFRKYPATIRVDGQIRFKNTTCGRSLFLNTKEKISVFENTWLLYVWTGTKFEDCFKIK